MRDFFPDHSAPRRNYGSIAGWAVFTVAGTLFVLMLFISAVHRIYNPAPPAPPTIVTQTDAEIIRPCQPDASGSFWLYRESTGRYSVGDAAHRRIIAPDDGSVLYVCPVVKDKS